MQAHGQLVRALVLGGARSGKSAFAERLAGDLEAPVLYVATATALDDEMAERIRLHQARRPPDWRTIESPYSLRSIDLADARTVLVEDLTLLLSNLMLRESESAEGKAIEEVGGLLQRQANLILVTNEVGMGLVPPYPLGRQFRDSLGRVNQFAAAQVNEVYLMLAGLPLRLK